MTTPLPILGLLEACRGREVWVVGDLMLDEYVQGPVERISPEAPVPVVRVRDVEFRLGGAANVARQVAALGAHAVLGGVVGDDEAGQRLLTECARVGIDTRAVVVEPTRPTTRKLRVLGHGQQLLRLDWEDAQPCPEAITAHLLGKLEAGARPDAVILSDYAKGLLTLPAIATLVNAARRAGCRVLVDPKRRDFSAYRGASLLTPNLGELALAAGVRLDPDDTAAIAASARPLIEQAGLDSMLVTLSDRGMLLVPASGAPRHVPAVRRAVADVTGAGDTVVAVLAATLAGGAPVEQAMEIANVAAGLAVGEIGAVAIEPERIRAALTDRPGGKIVTREELAARAAGWRVAGKRIVFTNGCFDLLHAGHLALLHEAAALGDVLVLAINSDESVRRLKGPERPIVPAAERAALLAALSCVDAVAIFDEDTPLETLRAVRPHVLVKGQDYTIANVVGRELVEAEGGRVALVPLLPEKSTSALVERIRRGAQPG
ncbi:MAG TPA: D-glycero-beta-D-manno-heptose-7-phosphate kinase [Steroidobacteraceae bacterium]|nr:D-glycero-beta-D-manno-heptose-7-phosphate kinase [Steroidobacteraceae bacterium]